MALECFSLSSAISLGLSCGRRNITPSSEAHPSKECLLLSKKSSMSASLNVADFSLPLHKYGLSSEYISADRRTILPHTLFEAGNHSAGARHMILPFDLHEDPAAFTPENRQLLFDIFPEGVAVSFDKRFLYFRMKVMPSTPTPLTIAGIPSYFTTRLQDEGVPTPMKQLGSFEIRLHQHLDYRFRLAERHKLFALIKNYFSDTVIPITEIQYWDNFVVIVLESGNADLTKVPRVVARCPCFYLFETEMNRPDELPAERIKTPTVDTYDDSEYTTLQPGIMLSSATDKTTGLQFRTTAGMLVQDERGDKYMTVASQGFPHDPRVFHPHTEGREIGEVVVRFPNSDVALARLRTEETFTNDLFQSSHASNPVQSLQGFTRCDEINTGDFVYMDSAFTGHVEGVAQIHTTTLTTGSEDKWVNTRWHYMGQGRALSYVDGSQCGSAMWNDEGKVFGFFRYAPTSGYFLGWCQSLSVDKLIDQGFIMAS